MHLRISKHYIKRLSFFAAILIYQFSVFGQDYNGKVVSENYEPIIGAYITHQQSQQHSHSDEFGRFQIKNANEGDTLSIHHIGFDNCKYIIQNISREELIFLTESVFNLQEIVVGQNIKKANIIAAIDYKKSPVNSSQEILRKVPGLFIGQHAGGGKAEQIFLRGFDIDHGTDVHLSVDGIPVNMVSHAHGQGYSDLHFLIPETIDILDFGKGPYFADKGNFGTAGYVKFRTKDKLENSLVSLEAGMFGSFRAVSLLKLLDSEDHNVYFASEYMLSDGPFDSPQNFERSNFMAKYTGEVGQNTRLSFTASHFSSSWDASGQIPQRLVDQNIISRFGAVDDTEGGNTSRTNVVLNFTRSINDKTFVKNTFFYSKYDFTLFSNFTFFQNDPINGDQIKQHENRNLLGFETVLNHSTFLNNASTNLQFGIGLRSDQIRDNELSHTANRRTTLVRFALGDVNEKNIYSYFSVDYDLGKWLFQPGLRFDYFKFNYVSALDSTYANNSINDFLFSPKFNIIYNYNNKVQFFLKSGKGFHSNDTRVIIGNESNSILPAAYGADLGFVWKPAPRLITNFALWYLFLEQEFVYVGDEGIVEPSGRTRRMGVDAGVRYQINDWFYMHLDFNYALARSREEPAGFDFIPLAPVATSSGGISFKKKNWYAALQTRYLMDRPAKEDNSIIAPGYMITDLNLSYSFKKVTIGLVIENLFNQEWNETQFATETRLKLEQISVEEIHFTPGTPFFLKGMVKYVF